MQASLKFETWNLLHALDYLASDRERVAVERMVCARWVNASDSNYRRAADLQFILRSELSTHQHKITLWGASDLGGEHLSLIRGLRTWKIILVLCNIGEPEADVSTSGFRINTVSEFAW